MVQAGYRINLFSCLDADAGLIYHMTSAKVSKTADEIWDSYMDYAEQWHSDEHSITRQQFDKYLSGLVEAYFVLCQDT